MPTELDRTIGRRIREQRRRRRLTQRELAALIGSRHTTISEYELGHRQISAARLHDISRALRTSIGRLLAPSATPSAGTA